MAHTYILKTANDDYYVGSTENIEKRLAEHRAGKVKSTKGKLPIELVFKESYNLKSEAQKKEYKKKDGKVKE